MEESKNAVSVVDEFRAKYSFAALNFTPDWTELMTEDEFNKNFDYVHKFSGPGWYFAGEDSLLVVLAPAAESPERFGRQAPFAVHCFNKANALSAFIAITKLPVRTVV